MPRYDSLESLANGASFADLGIRDLTKRSPRGKSFAELGLSGLQQFSGYVIQDFLPELRHQRSAYRVFREMSDNDSTVGAMLYVVEQLIQGTSLEIIPGEETPEAEGDAELIRTAMHDMEQPWSVTLSEILTSLPFGWALMEITLKRREGFNRNPRLDSQYNDGKFGWQRIALRGQESLERWVIDDTTGDILAMEQLAPPDYAIRHVPIAKSMLFRYKPTLNNPEGRSILRNAFRSWLFKKRFEEIEGIGIERDLTGLPVITPPEGVDIWNVNDDNANIVRARAEAIVRNIRADQHQGVVLPFGWELELLASRGQRQIDTSAIITRLDQRIAVTILADMLLIGQDRVGSFALVSAKQRLFSSALESIATGIAGQFNRYAIPRLLRANGRPTEKPPQMRFGPVEDVDFKSLAEYINKLTGANVLTPDVPLERYLRQVANFPEHDPDTARLPMPEGQGEGSTGVPQPGKPKPSEEEEEEGNGEGAMEEVTEGLPTAEEIFGPGAI